MMWARSTQAGTESRPGSRRLPEAAICSLLVPPGHFHFICPVPVKQHRRLAGSPESPPFPCPHDSGPSAS